MWVGRAGSYAPIEGDRSHTGCRRCSLLLPITFLGLVCASFIVLCQLLLDVTANTFVDLREPRLEDRIKTFRLRLEDVTLR